MSVILQRQPSRYRLQVGARDFGEVTLEEARGIRDAIDDYLVAQMTSFDVIVDRATAYYGLKSGAIFTPTRGVAICASARLLAMALVRELNPHLTDGNVARLFNRDRSLVNHATNWLAAKEADPVQARALATLRAVITRQLEEPAQP